MKPTHNTDWNLTYYKSRNDELFNTLKNEKLMNLSAVQNYIPIYERFFSLTEHNWNGLNLNQRCRLVEAVGKISPTSENEFIVMVESPIQSVPARANGGNKKVMAKRRGKPTKAGATSSTSHQEAPAQQYQTTRTRAFFKYSPILDPVRYMIGKYSKYDTTRLSTLPVHAEYDGINAPDTPKPDYFPLIQKMYRANNTAYVDAFFSYLSSKLLNTYYFPHGIEFFGCYLGIKRKLRINISDDIEYLRESKYFMTHAGRGFHIENEYHAQMMNFDTRNNKMRIVFKEDVEGGVEGGKVSGAGVAYGVRQPATASGAGAGAEIHADTHSVISVDSVEEFTDIFTTEVATETATDAPTTTTSTSASTTIPSSEFDSFVEHVRNPQDSSGQIDFDFDSLPRIASSNNKVQGGGRDGGGDGDDATSQISSGSDCSSRSSHTTTSAELTENRVGGEDGREHPTSADPQHTSNYGSSGTHSGSVSKDSDYSTATEDVVWAVLDDFPVAVIAQEKLVGTLDSLVVHPKIQWNAPEWASMLFQIVATLTAYQRVFDFTHNDLHTNNVMYVKTDEPNLFYKIGGEFYRVPTFGRVYKIIDFGRAIYRFMGRTICSDSFYPDGDASTQYNFGPFLNDKMPVIEPNKSFDLCRFACSLYDILFDTDESESGEDEDLEGEGEREKEREEGGRDGSETHSVDHLTELTEQSDGEDDNNSQSDSDNESSDSGDSGSGSDGTSSDATSEEDPMDAICDIVEDWCMDDSNGHIMYKSSGEERYPGFKLYKMIARRVHNHVPSKQFKHDAFQWFKIQRNRIPPKAQVIDIDAMKPMTELPVGN